MYLTPNFDSDYAHARRNLGESYWLFDLASKIPRLPINHLNFLIERWIPTDMRNSLLKQIAKGEVDMAQSPNKGLLAYKRNLQSIIDIAKSNNTRVILSTYCHFLYDDIRGDELHELYRDIVQQENDIMRQLAKDNDLALVDNANMVPQEEKYFVDSIHFSPEGMKLIAKNIYQAV